MTLGRAVRRSCIVIAALCFIVSTALGAIRYRDGGGCVCVTVDIPFTHYYLYLCQCSPDGDPKATR